MESEITDEKTMAEQAERCRRLASMMVDDELRRSLEDLAHEYEQRVRDDGGHFMLSGESGSDAAGAR